MIGNLEKNTIYNIDCKKCPAKETCTVDYWKGCGDNFMEWAKSEEAT